MSITKELKSIDLASYTTILTAISVIFSIIVAVIIAVAIGIISSENIAFGIYLIPTIVIGTLMISIYERFFEGFLYNTLTKKLNAITFTFDGDKISGISTTPTAILAAIISTIFVILTYLATIFIVPLMISSAIQTMMFAGQDAVAYSLYQVLLLINQPSLIGLFIVGSFIISFVFVLIGTYVYNTLGSKDRGIIVKLSENNGITTLESIDALSAATTIAIISGVLNIILAVIGIISGLPVQNAIGNIISGFVSGFIISAILAVLYNILAPKFGKLKIELIDQ